MLLVLEKILRSYDDLIAERMSHHGGVIPLSKRRKGLGCHVRKADPEGRYCHDRRIKKRGYRNHPRQFSGPLYKRGLSQIALFEKFGVSQPAISAVVRRGEKIVSVHP
jgi:hypothetical protein